ncbi:TraJ protein (plasmid) [Pantoea sp. JZ29]|uniref:TraJ protein n=1 Tax=unclassified Pantoea TaxID=2630326 RepID=UPI002B4A0D10|nr:TraJ protein [Pantoea sp. JZ29]WRH23540.1 TraJ protein [Pantoea sp. JZ29]
MAAEDLSAFSHLSKFFPELTEIQAAHVCMLVFSSWSAEEIAEYRNVTVDTVKDSLVAAQKRLRADNMKLLRGVAILRVMMSISFFIYGNNLP